MTGDSRRDANQHLLNIIARKGLDANSHVPQGIVKDLEAAVKVFVLPISPMARAACC